MEASVSVEKTLFSRMEYSLLSLILLVSISCGAGISVKKLSDDVLLISAGSLNMSAVRTGNELVVIDTLHSPAAAEKALRKIRKIFPGLSVSVVVNTHGHHDHTYGNQVFKGAKIYGHKNTGHWMKLSMDLPGVILNTKEWKGFQLTFPKYIITRPEIIESGGVKIFLIPFGNSHSSSDILIAIPSKGILFAGDLFFSRGFPNFKHYSSNEWSPGDWDPDQWLKAIELVFSLGSYDHVVAGHGEPFPPERLLLWYKYFDRLQKQISASISEGKSVNVTVPQLGQDRSYATLFENLNFSEFPGANHNTFIREFYLLQLKKAK